MLRTAIATIALLAALPAQAQAQDKPAVKDTAGHLYCNSNGVDLRETGDGTYTVNMVFEHLGDTANAVYPPGGTRLFAPRTELRPYVSVNYEFPLSAAGMPQGQPKVGRLSLSTGRFDGARLEPAESVTLQLLAGQILSQPIPINEGLYTIATPSAEVAPPGSSNPYDTEWTRDILDPLVTAFESKERWILLSHHGKEVARIPVPQRDILKERDRMIAYVRAAVPLITQGKCPS